MRLASEKMSRPVDGTMKYRLECTNCKSNFGSDNKALVCPSCGEALDTAYSIDKVRETLTKKVSKPDRCLCGNILNSFPLMTLLRL